VPIPLLVGKLTNFRRVGLTPPHRSARPFNDTHPLVESAPPSQIAPPNAGASCLSPSKTVV